MSKISKDEFKKAVLTAFAERGYSKVKISMALFGLQGDVSFHRDGVLGKQEAKTSVKEKDGRLFLEIEQKDGTDWEWEIKEY